MDDMNMGAATDGATTPTPAGDMGAEEMCPAMCGHKAHGMEKCGECECMGGEKHEDMPMAGGDTGGGDAPAA